MTQTEDVPQAAPLTFHEIVRSVPAPRGWIVTAKNQADPEARDPHHVAALPIPDKMSLEAWLVHHGATVGIYHCALDPISANTTAAKRQRLDRLQMKGPTTAIITVAEQHVAEESDAFPDPGETKPERRATKGEPSIVRSAQEAAAAQRAENERLTAEIENKRLRRKLAEVDGIEPSSTSGGGIAALLAPFVPIAVELVRGFVTNQKAQAEAIQALLQRPAEMMPMAAPAGNELSLSTLLGLVPQLKEFGKLLGGFVGGPRRDDDEEPQSETMAMLGMVRDLLQGNAATTTPSPAVTNGNPAATHRRPSPAEQMSIRVLQFMSRILREQQLTADPAVTADKLFDQIGTLPAEFRALLATAENVETLLAGLPKWLPASMRVEVPNRIRQDEAGKRWLQTFLETVAQLAAGEGAAVDHGDGEESDDA